jgi:hypothetical protein
MQHTIHLKYYIYKYDLKEKNPLFISKIYPKQTFIDLQTFIEHIHKEFIIFIYLFIINMLYMYIP